MKDDNDLDNNDKSGTKKANHPHHPEKDATTVGNKKDDRSTMPKKDDDGDEYSPEDSWRSPGNYPPSSTLYEKMSKENAQYMKGVPFENCGKCNYYQAGHCKIVRGYIEQSMVCKYFSEKYTATSFTMMISKRK